MKRTTHGLPLVLAILSCACSGPVIPAADPPPVLPLIAKVWILERTEGVTDARAALQSTMSGRGRRLVSVESLTFVPGEHRDVELRDGWTLRLHFGAPAASGAYPVLLEVAEPGSDVFGPGPLTGTLGCPATCGQFWAHLNVPWQSSVVIHANTLIEFDLHAPPSWRGSVLRH